MAWSCLDTSELIAFAKPTAAKAHLLPTKPFTGWCIIFGYLKNEWFLTLIFLLGIELIINAHGPSCSKPLQQCFCRAMRTGSFPLFRRRPQGRLQYPSSVLKVLRPSLRFAPESGRAFIRLLTASLLEVPKCGRRQGCYQFYKANPRTYPVMHSFDSKKLIRCVVVLVGR